MKRVLAFLAVFVFAALFISPVRADREQQIVFTLSDVEGVSTGDSFTVVLNVSGEYRVHGLSLSIEFDPSTMTYEGLERGQYLSDVQSLGCLVVLDDEKLIDQGRIKLGIICPTTPASGSGEVFKMRFHVNSGVTVNQQVIMVVDECGYMPLGVTKSTPVSYKTDNSIIVLNGGSAPTDGYNEGESGVGGNKLGASSSSAPTTAPNTALPTPDGGATEATSLAPSEFAESRSKNASAAPIDEATPATAEATTDAPATADSAAPAQFPLLLVLAGLGVTAVAGVLVFFIIKSKRR